MRSLPLKKGRDSRRVSRQGPPLAVCEQRDVKGLYRRARANQIPEFTGITSPYETPESPEVTVRSDLLSIEDCAALVLKEVEMRLKG
jgi:adenylylsulfate kinase-like enzyme